MHSSRHRSRSIQGRIRPDAQHAVYSGNSRRVSREIPTALRDATVDSRAIPSTSSLLSSLGDRSQDISHMSDVEPVFYTSTWSNLTAWRNGKELASSTSTFGSNRRTRAIPAKHEETLHRTKMRISEATRAVLGPTGDIAHELLAMGADALQFVPVPALDLAAKALLGIWDAVKAIESNRLACLRLAERCADMLLSVREEIHLGGVRLATDMKAPIMKLETTFGEICAFLRKQMCRPFLHRYLKRDDIQRDIQHCDVLLSDALGMFNVKIQLRMLRLVSASEECRSHSPTGELSASPATQKNSHVAIERSGSDSYGVQDADAVHTLLKDYKDSQNSRDVADDAEDLQQLMQSALQKRNDAAVVEVLQVDRDEMLEAIQTLQRALDREVNEHRATSMALNSALEASRRSRTTPSMDESVDREFIQCGIDALRRLSQGSNLSMPIWTITRFEVELDEVIGVGFFSNVYKGIWYHHTRAVTVAIKILAEVTPRKLFVHEANVWKQLNHPNVLELLGASSTTSKPPWFFVSPYYRNGNLIDYLRSLGSLSRVDILKMLQEIARGMSYLHRRWIIHGDFKASNVLVSDTLSCVVADFGQSEMRSEVFRLSGQPMPRGTLRWQSPELMKGMITELTSEIDVYAFGISCVEIFSLGSLPWPGLDDDSVRYLVCSEKKRPVLPDLPILRGPLFDIIQSAWSESPASRPSFRKIFQKLEKLRAQPVVISSVEYRTEYTSLTTRASESASLYGGRGDGNRTRTDREYRVSHSNRSVNASVVDRNPDLASTRSYRISDAEDTVNDAYADPLYVTLSNRLSHSNVLEPQQYIRHQVTPGGTDSILRTADQQRPRDANPQTHATLLPRPAPTGKQRHRFSRSLSQVDKELPNPPDEYRLVSEKKLYTAHPTRARQRIVSQPNSDIQLPPSLNFLSSNRTSAHVEYDDVEARARGRQGQRRHGSFSSQIPSASEPSRPLYPASRTDPLVPRIPVRAYTSALDPYDDREHGLNSTPPQEDLPDSLAASASDSEYTSLRTLRSESVDHRDITGRDSSPASMASTTISAFELTLPSDQPSPPITPMERPESPTRRVLLSMGGPPEPADEAICLQPISVDGPSGRGATNRSPAGQSRPSSPLNDSFTSDSPKSVLDTTSALPSRMTTPSTDRSPVSSSKVTSTNPDVEQEQLSTKPPLIVQPRPTELSQITLVQGCAQSPVKLSLSDHEDGSLLRQPQNVPQVPAFSTAVRGVSAGIAARIANLRLQTLQHADQLTSPSTTKDSHVPSAGEKKAAQSVQASQQSAPESLISSHKERTRRGYWNRRGDHLTPDGYIVRAPYGRTYPSELNLYPDGDYQFRNHILKEAKDSRYRDLPFAGSAQYDAYIQYCDP